MITEPVPYPAGEYAIVEILGHRTLIGRVTEVERFGAKFLSVEAIWEDELLPAVMIGGASIYQFTPCSAEIAHKRQAIELYQLAAPVRELIPAPALPAPAQQEAEGLFDDEIEALLTIQNAAGSVMASTLKAGVVETLTIGGYVMQLSDTPEDAATIRVSMTCKGSAFLDEHIPF